MASEKVLEMKKAQVAELAGKMTDSVAGVLVEYKGINVADDTNLRRELREAGIDYSVIKNSIISRAAEEAGLEPASSRTSPKRTISSRSRAVT